MFDGSANWDRKMADLVCSFGFFAGLLIHVVQAGFLESSQCPELGQPNSKVWFSLKIRKHATRGRFKKQ